VFRFGWERVDAKLIDQKFVRRDSYNAKTNIYFQVWDYMVELPGRDGRPTRVVIREKTFKLKLPEIGGVVPVKVNKRRTKAVFDLKDPRIDADAARKSRRAREKAEDESRFEAKLRESETASARTRSGP
jgi:hypothetical protein